MLFLQTLALQSFNSTCLSRSGRPDEKDPPSPVQRHMMSKATRIAGGTRHDTQHSCNEHLIWATVQGLSLGVQTSLSHCSVSRANVQADPWLPFRKGARSLLRGRYCSYSLFNRPGQRPSLQCLPLRHLSFSGLKNMPSAEISGLKQPLFRRVIFSGHLTAALCKQGYFAWLKGFGYCNFFNRFFPLFTKYSTGFFSISICLQWGELDFIRGYYNG